jgi:membrane protease YdiL (CAAX protease family)
MNESSSAEIAAENGNGFAKRLRGFGPIGILAILIILAGNFIIEPVSAVLALIWARISNTSWRELGYVRPRSWTKAIVIGVVFGVALKFTMKAVLMPLLGAPPINEAFRFVTGNPEAIPFMLYAIIIGAGFGEETLYRGWMFERLGKLFGHSMAAKIAIVLITSVLFAAAHYTGQGIPGVEQALVVGTVFASIFAVTGKLFTLMVAHTAFDLTALWMIYYGLETRVAHLIFK